jgi:hypothetical protein
MKWEGLGLSAVILEERAPYSRPLKLAMAFLILWLAGTATFSMGRSEESQPVIAATAGVIALAFLSFFNMRFRITTEGVEATMPPFIKKMGYDEMTDVYVGRTPWYIGWGLRVWGRRLTFVSRHGPAVYIEKKKGLFHTLVLTPADPKGFAKMVKEQAGLK